MGLFLSGRMNAAVLVLVLVLGSWTGNILSVSGSDWVTAWYDETITVPCLGAADGTRNIVFIKWKYEKDDGSAADLLVKQIRSNKQTIQATDGYATRVGLDASYSLLISRATLRDQKTFTCMVVSAVNIREFPVQVYVHKKPSVEILDKADFLLKDKLTTVGTCVASDSNPPANVTWWKNGSLLEHDGKGVSITPSLQLNPSTGLSTTSSVLRFSSSRADAGAVFSCVSEFLETREEVTLDPLPVHYPSENVTLQVLTRPPIVEGINVTLRCHGDGNPPPTSFLFTFQGRKTLVENRDSLTLPSVRRDDAGEYGCSLPGDEGLQDYRTVHVNYLDLDLDLDLDQDQDQDQDQDRDRDSGPPGSVLKLLGQNLTLRVQKNSSEETAVRWTKDGDPLQQLELTNLSYDDAGRYEVEGSVPGVRRQQSFQLLVEGPPLISRLTRDQDPDQPTLKTVICEAEADPEPRFTWSLNATAVRTSYLDRTAVQTVQVVVSSNITVSCSVRNRHGGDKRSISISGPPAGSQNQAGIIGGVVAVLIFIVLVLVGWLCMRKFRQGSYRPEIQLEHGTLEETERLERRENGEVNGDVNGEVNGRT